MAHLVAQLHCGEFQYPTLVLFLGKTAKDDALDSLFPHNHVRGRRKHKSAINLHLESASAHSDYPILFADCDPTLQVRVAPDTSPDAATRHFYPLPPGCQLSKSQILEDVLTRIIFTFIDVICLFADDCGGLYGARSLLSTWATSYNHSGSTVPWRPHIVVT